MFWSLCFLVTHCQSTHQIDPDFKIDDDRMALFIKAIEVDAQRRLQGSKYIDQTRMEQLFQTFPEATQKKLKDRSGKFLDVCEWPNITCDNAKRVTEIAELDGSAGSINCAHIPPKVMKFRMVLAGLSGSLNTSEFSDSLKEFVINDNGFGGTVNLRTLPREIEHLSLNANKFHGSADLRTLPRSLEFLDIGDNRFSGTLCLTELPPRMEVLVVFYNDFTGNFRLKNAPATLTEINAERNNFDAVAIVPQDKCVFLKESGVESIVDAKGRKHRKEKFMLTEDSWLH